MYPVFVSHTHSKTTQLLGQERHRMKKRRTHLYTPETKPTPSLRTTELTCTDPRQREVKKRRSWVPPPDWGRTIYDQSVTFCSYSLPPTRFSL